jgi:uncharacterized protein YcfJ
MKKIAIITALLLMSNVAIANDSYWGQIIGGVAGGIIGNQVGGGSGKIVTTAIGASVGAIVGGRVQDNMRYNEYSRQPVIVQNNPPIIMQQNPSVNRRLGFNPIYQWQDIADESCGCYRRILVQIN